MWDASDEASTATFAHDAWARFLERYVTPDEDGVNRVNYAAVTADDRAALDAYVA